MGEPCPGNLELPEQALVEGVLRQQVWALAKTITLLESSRNDHRRRARRVLQALLPHARTTIRVGISGAPGTGKSTFIEALGLHLLERGHRVAVLAVDPSSTVSGGAILGDKTRMEYLSRSPDAYIRPSPSAGTLGGVAEKTRETMLVCEAAGFDVIIIETVGVGQSEIAVSGIVDAFVLLQLPNTGDDLQAIKKGIVELADIVVINKADIDPGAAAQARAQLESALGMLRHASSRWSPPVVTVSALEKRGVADFWQEIDRYRAVMDNSGEFTARRRRQALTWMWELIDHGLRQRFREHPAVRTELEQLSQAVELGEMTPAAAANRLLDNTSSTNGGKPRCR